MAQSMDRSRVWTAVAIAGAVLLARPAAAQQPCFQVQTFAGRGIGDGGPGAQAIFTSPRGVAIDAAGNVYVADADDARVRKIDAGGTVTTIAGNGAPGKPEDGAPAVETTLKQPSGIAIDAQGNLFIVDTGSHSVWKLTSDGVIHRAAGSGIQTGSIDGDNPSQFGEDPTDDLNDGELAAFATLNAPVRAAVDGSGNLFISDTGNDRIRRVDAATGRMSTVVSANDGISSPIGMTFGPDGALYVANRGTNQILRIVGSAVSVFVNASGTAGPGGDGGPAAGAQLNGASDLAFDASGNLWIADTQSSWIRKVDANGTISRPVGTGTPGYVEGQPGKFTRLFHPGGVAVASNGTIVIADTDNNRIRRYDAAADLMSLIAGGGGSPGDGGPATQALLDRPTGLAVDPAGNVYVTEHDSFRVRKIAPDGTIETVVNQQGKSGVPTDGTRALDAMLDEPTGVEVDPSGDLLIADAQDHHVYLVDPTGILHFFAGNGTGGFAGDGGPATAAELNTPLRMAIGSDGIYIADFNNNRIRRVASDGTISTFAGPETNAGLNQPSGLAFDGAGNLYVADFSNNRIVKIDRNGSASTLGGGHQAGSDGDGGPVNAAHFDGPTDVIVAKDGALLVVDQNNNKVRRIAPDGSGNITPAGTVATIVGNGKPGFKDGTGDQAELLIPTDIAIDGNGNLLIADRGNQLVRLATPGTGCGTGGGGGSCQTAADCDDHDACTVDSCSQGGTCTHDRIGSGDCQPTCESEPDGCIPGGGPGRVDCLGELLVRGPLVDRNGRPAPVVKCHDGDASCDFDSIPGQCTFRLSWCLNVPDSRIGCSASGVTQQTVTGPAQATLLGALAKLAPQNASQGGRSVTFSPAITASDQCTELTGMTVALRKNGRKPGKMQIRGVAVSAGPPRRRDVDSIRLVCLP